MSLRTDLLALLSREPRSVSSLARELHVTKGELEDHLQHMIRTARAAGHHVIVEPAFCRNCAFQFGEGKLIKPGKCPRCRGTRLVEARLRVA